MIPLFILAAAPLMVGSRPSPLCVCSHPRDRHQHLRRDSDCGSCGSRICDAYRPAGWRAVVREVLALMWAPGAEPAGDFAPAVIDTSSELGEPGDVIWLERPDDGLRPSSWTWLYGGEK